MLACTQVLSYTCARMRISTHMGASMHARTHKQGRNVRTHAIERMGASVRVCAACTDAHLLRKLSITSRAAITTAPSDAAPSTLLSSRAELPLNSCTRLVKIE